MSCNALTAHTEQDRIAHVQLRSVNIPLKTAVSDAKVLTGRQKALAEVSMLVRWMY